MFVLLYFIEFELQQSSMFCWNEIKTIKIKYVVYQNKIYGFLLQKYLQVYLFFQNYVFKNQILLSRSPIFR